MVFQRSAAVLLCLSLCAGCATSPKTSARNPAQSEQEMPPPANAVDMWAYSWTDAPIAATNPQEFVKTALTHAEECVGKIGKTESTVAHCEGDEMAAGPGLYTCDNPFTSHDYGSTVVMVHVHAQGNAMALATGKFAAAAASGGLDREIYANPAFAGIVYDFRTNSLNGRALVLRNKKAVDLAASTAVTVNPASYTVFGRHEMYACTPSTSFQDIVQHWGDHFEYLSLVFDFFGDPDERKYVVGGKPNRAGYAAAIASDAVAADDATLTQRLKTLKEKVPSLKDSISDPLCRETNTYSVRSCIARRVFDSLLDNMGSPNRPTYAWKLNELKHALLILKVAGPKDVEAKTSRDLMIKMAVSYAEVAPQILTAYNCMLAVRTNVAKTHFGLWGEEPY